MTAALSKATPTEIQPTTTPTYQSHIREIYLTATKTYPPTVTFPINRLKTYKELKLAHPLTEQIAYLAPDRPPDETKVPVEVPSSSQIAILKPHLDTQLRSKNINQENQHRPPPQQTASPKLINQILTVFKPRLNSITKPYHPPSNYLIMPSNNNNNNNTNNNSTAGLRVKSTTKPRVRKGGKGGKRGGKGSRKRGGKNQTTALVRDHFSTTTNKIPTTPKDRGTADKHNLSPSDSVLSGGDHKKSDTRVTPTRANNHENSVSPDSIEGPPKLASKLNKNETDFLPTTNNGHPPSPLRNQTGAKPPTPDPTWSDTSDSESVLSLLLQEAKDKTKEKEASQLDNLDSTPKLTILSNHGKKNSSILSKKSNFSSNKDKTRPNSTKEDALWLSDSSASSVLSTSTSNSDDSDKTQDLAEQVDKEKTNMTKSPPPSLPTPTKSKTNTNPPPKSPALTANDPVDMDTEDATDTSKKTNAISATSDIRSTSTGSTASLTTTTSAADYRKSVIDGYDRRQEDSRLYSFLRQGKFPRTKAWKDTPDRQIAQNKPFTHLEGISREGNHTDPDSIQDGLDKLFEPASTRYFDKKWDDPDLTTKQLTDFASLLSKPSKQSTLNWSYDPIGQEARHILIRLAQTSPETFDDQWSYTTGNLNTCNEGKIWLAANSIYGSHWKIAQPTRMPKPKQKTKKTARISQSQPTFQTIGGTRGRFMARNTKQPHLENNITDVTEKVPRQWQTFFTMTSPALTAGGAEGETQLLENFNLGMEILLDADKTFVVYVWPTKAKQNKSVIPYGKKHLEASYTKVTKISSKAELLRYSKTVYTAEGKKCWLKILAGHNVPLDELVSDTVKNHFTNVQMSFYSETLQAAFPVVCGWLLGADPMSFNSDHFTALLRSLPKFAILPVACRRRKLKMTKNERIDPEGGVDAIVILCDGNYLAASNLALKATFNRSTPAAIADRPDGLNFKYIEYFAEPSSRQPTNTQLNQTMKAKIKQGQFSEVIRRIRISGIEDIDYAIQLNINDETKTTMREVLMGLKCQSNYRYPIFSQIHVQRDNSVIGVCHREQAAEGEAILGHLSVILEQRYGKQSKAWFTRQTLDSAKGYHFCEKTNQVVHDDDESEDDVLKGFYTELSPASAANALAAGETIEEDYDGNLDDIDIGTEQHLKIDMEILFNETPHGKGGGYDDAQSVVTMMTGVTNATSAIQDALAPSNAVIGGNNTDTEEDDNMSGITTNRSDNTSTSNNNKNNQQTPADNSASAQQTGVNNKNQ